jgi:hypothetical protein
VPVAVRSKSSLRSAPSPFLVGERARITPCAAADGKATAAQGGAAAHAWACDAGKVRTARPGHAGDDETPAIMIQVPEAFAESLDRPLQFSARYRDADPQLPAVISLLSQQPLAAP